MQKVLRYLSPVERLMSIITILLTCLQVWLNLKVPVLHDQDYRTARNQTGLAQSNHATRWLDAGLCRQWCDHGWIDQLFCCQNRCWTS